MESTTSAELERLTDELRMDRDIVGLTRPLPACPAGEAVPRLRRGPSQLSVSRPLAGGPMGRQPGGLGIPSDSLGNSFTGRTSRPGSRRPLGSREPGDEPSVLNATVKRSRARRKPRLLFRFSGSFLLRFADRALRGLLFQLPPRITRFAACDRSPAAILAHGGGIPNSKRPVSG